MSRTRRSVKTRLAPLALVILTGGAIAGPLNPPAGPVTSTMKTMTEVEPRIAINATNTPGDSDSLFRIIQPGSYYLTGNIQGVAGKHGIEVFARNVTIDLNGFAVGGDLGTLNGVFVPPQANSVTIRNGFVSNWGGHGIDAFGANNCRIDGINASRNTGDAIRAGVGARILNCQAFENSANGIVISGSGMISGCWAEDHTGTGIVAGQQCMVLQCTAVANDVRGISVDLGSTVQGCVARANGIDGVSCTSSCVILNNALTQNGLLATDGAGVYVTGVDNRIESNNCVGADLGVDVDAPGNIIIKNTCSGNTTNWSIVAGNAVAPIVNATNNALPINGNTYTGGLGSTDSNANFTF